MLKQEMPEKAHKYMSIMRERTIEAMRSIEDEVRDLVVERIVFAPHIHMFFLLYTSVMEQPNKTFLGREVCSHGRESRVETIIENGRGTFIPIDFSELDDIKKWFERVAREAGRGLKEST